MAGFFDWDQNLLRWSLKRAVIDKAIDKKIELEFTPLEFETKEATTQA